MQATLGADSVDRALCAHAPSSASRLNRFLVAGVAVVGATAIAATPVTPSMPTAHDVEQYAVTLAAAANPLDDLGALFENTLTNVGQLGNGVLATSLPAVARAITNPEIYTDFVKFLGSNALNPLPLLQQLVGFPGTYGGVIGAGLQAGSVAFQDRLSQLPTVLTNTLEFLRTGQFVEAFSEVNVWFLVSIERALVPLLPVLGIPGDVLASLPGGERLAAVFDTVLKRGIFTEFTRSLLGPLASAGLQFALVLDDIREAVVTGDLGSAASNLVGLPIKVANALVNGFVPPFTSRSPWTGILGDRGTLDYFFVDLPKALADAFNNPVYPVPAPPVTTQSIVPDVASTDLVLSDNAVALKAIAASNVEGAAPAADVDEAAPAEEATPAADVEETAPVDEAEETAPAQEAETPADDAAGTDADAGTDTDTDTTGADTGSGSTGGATTGAGTADGNTSGEGASDDNKSDEGKSGETKTRGSKPGETKTRGGKSDESKSGESKSGEGKSGETNTRGSKPGEAKSGASKSGASTSAGSTSGGSDSGSSE